MSLLSSQKGDRKDIKLHITRSIGSIKNVLTVLRWPQKSEIKRHVTRHKRSINVLTVLR